MKRLIGRSVIDLLVTVAWLFLAIAWSDSLGWLIVASCLAGSMIAISLFDAYVLYHCWLFERAIKQLELKKQQNGKHDLFLERHDG